jgi:putative transposase
MRNSPTERLFQNLNSERIPVSSYGDIAHVVQDILLWMHVWYNEKRPHKHSGGLSPYDYENQWKGAIKVS